MHRDDEDTLVTDPMVDAIDDGDTPANGTPPLSVLERLKARRGELAETRTFDLEVPGTGGLLVLRLGVLPRQRLAALTQRATKGGAEADLNLNADTLIAATRNVLARNHRDDPLTPIDPDPANPVRIDERLAAMLGLPEATRARQVLDAVFGLAPSPDLAIGVSAGQYLEWASAADSELDEEFVGESQAAPR
jgi:hypothetical protein